MIDMDFDKLVEAAKENEGFRQTAYRDSLGRLTVGYGLCIDPEVIGAGITEEEAAAILTMRLRAVRDSVARAIPDLETMPDPVQRALVEMAYQMGVGGLTGFRKMLLALEARDYETAADEALDSVWSRQTPNRAKKVTDLMRGAG